MKNLFVILILTMLSLASFAQKAPRIKTVTPVCDSVLFSYTATTNVLPMFNTTYTWTRAAVTGIANAAASANNGIINEYLKNTTPNPLVVKYAITLTENTGCTHQDSLFVTVNPTPRLNSIISTAICDSTAFVYTATTLTNNATFVWSRAALPGIANPAANGTGTAINETLSNITGDDVVVKYAFTITANGCSNTDTVYVTVHPTPFLVKMTPRFYPYKGGSNNNRLLLEGRKEESQV